jgi:hypothetical protein
MGVLPAWTPVVADPMTSRSAWRSPDAFIRAGAMVEVRCPTHRQASMLHGAPGELVSPRGAEFAAAAGVLDVTTTMLTDRAGGDLGDLPGAVVATEVVAATVASDADGFWVFYIELA